MPENFSMKRVNNLEIYQKPQQNRFRFRRTFGTGMEICANFERKSSAICGRIQDNQYLMNIFHQAGKIKKLQWKIWRVEVCDNFEGNCEIVNKIAMEIGNFPPCSALKREASHSVFQKKLLNKHLKVAIFIIFLDLSPKTVKHEGIGKYFPLILKNSTCICNGKFLIRKCKKFTSLLLTRHQEKLRRLGRW